MARQLRLEHHGAVWHAMSRGNNRCDIFLDDADRRKFLSLLEITVERFGWLLHEYALMTNHFHLAIETPEPTLSVGMKWLNQNYAQWINKRHGRVGHLFQGRFKSCLIEKETYLLEVMRYIALNPVRAHMVQRPQDYRWSSYRAKIGLEPAPAWLAPQWTLAQFGTDPVNQKNEYRKFVEAGAKIERNPLDDLVGQLFLGTQSWITRMRALIDEKPRDREHPAGQRYAGRPDANTIVKTVGEVFVDTPDHIRNSHGGVERMVVAWLGCYEGMARLGSIATALRLRSTSRVSELIRECERQLKRDPLLRVGIDACVERLRRGLVRVPVVHDQVHPGTQVRV